MCDEIRVDQDHQDRGRALDERLDILQRYEGLIAEAEGDAPLREFWSLSSANIKRTSSRSGWPSNERPDRVAVCLPDVNELCDVVEMRAGSPIRSEIRLRGFTGHAPEPRCHRLCGITMRMFARVMGVARSGSGMGPEKLVWSPVSERRRRLCIISKVCTNPSQDGRRHRDG